MKQQQPKEEEKTGAKDEEEKNKYPKQKEINKKIGTTKVLVTMFHFNGVKLIASFISHLVG